MPMRASTQSPAGDPRKSRSRGGCVQHREQHLPQARLVSPRQRAQDIPLDLSSYRRKITGDLASRSGHIQLATASVRRIDFAPDEPALNERLHNRHGVAGVDADQLSQPLLAERTRFAASASVPASQAGLASGVLNTSRQVGGSLGLAILATVATDRTAAALGLGRLAALSSGYARAFELAAAACVLAFATSFAVPAVRRRS
jgi:hypothetical protein